MFISIVLNNNSCLKAYEKSNKAATTEDGIRTSQRE